MLGSFTANQSSLGQLIFPPGVLEELLDSGSLACSKNDGLPPSTLLAQKRPGCIGFYKMGREVVLAPDAGHGRAVQASEAYKSVKVQLKRHVE